MSRRLATDAKIVLERAGYSVFDNTPALHRIELIAVDRSKHYALKVEGGTVDNALVVELLHARGRNEFGHLTTVLERYEPLGFTPLDWLKFGKPLEHPLTGDIVIVSVETGATFKTLTREEFDAAGGVMGLPDYTLREPRPMPRDPRPCKHAFINSYSYGATKRYCRICGESE